MSSEPKWLEIEAVIALHHESIARHGGAPGLRDRGLLESALARPANRFAYEGATDLAELAATYGAAVSANHAFSDGNKRAALICLGLFLRLNGLRLAVTNEAAFRTMLGVAAGEVGLNDLTAWVRANSRPA